MDENITFEEAVSGDPAVPGDPFARLRYHYGMLLGAEDFSVEQREKVLRRRLHQALLHGVGTVWGLRVALGDVDDDGLRTRVMVRPGLAVDALGRDLYIGAEQCLDLVDLGANPIWDELQPPEGAPAGSTQRRAYVVVRYEACRTRPVPAITPPCNDPGDAVAYSRVLDRCRVDLAAAPPEPHPVTREWLKALLAAGPTRSPRDVLLDLLLDPPAALERFWKAPVEAPMLLATIDLDLQGMGDATKVFAVDVPGNPDNRGRALLPAVQMVADSLFGQRLAGAPPAPLAFQVASWSVESAIKLRVRLTAAPHEDALKSTPVTLHRLDATGWTDLTASVALSWDAPTSDLVLDLSGESLGSGVTPVTYQIRLAGEAAGPLVSAGGLPLAGLVGDPITHPRQGRDVSILDSWKA